MEEYRNEFYTEFDFHTLEPRHNEDFRNPFQIDRDRIIYSSAFRRLQSKTQVFLSGEYDFYRTRLTHTLEVAQVARSITQYLLRTSKDLNRDYFIDPDLVEAIALAHDLGHPPFGHTGEKMLHQLMEGEYGGFEGNAQTLRILTELIYPSPDGRKGMAPTRALLDGVMKYKILYSEKDRDSSKYLYDDQSKYLGFVYNLPAGHLPEIHIRAQSIECQIMDWADNTAYSINDLLDGYKAGFITPQKLDEWGAENDSELTSEDKEILHTLISKLPEEAEFERFMSRQIGGFIRSVTLIPSKHPLKDETNRYKYELGIDPHYKATYKLYSKIAVDLIFSHPAIQQLEFKGKKIVRKIFEALTEEYIENPKPHALLPPKLHKRLISIEHKPTKYRLICDHIAGMTDAYVMRTYKKLFDPDFGSIMDIIE